MDTNKRIVKVALVNKAESHYTRVKEMTFDRAKGLARANAGRTSTGPNGQFVISHAVMQFDNDCKPFAFHP